MALMIPLDEAIKILADYIFETQRDMAQTSEAERNVIEAAKAAKADLRGYMRRHHELFGTSNPHFKHPFDGLLEAVEALEATEPAAAPPSDTDASDSD